MEGKSGNEGKVMRMRGEKEKEKDEMRRRMRAEKEEGVSGHRAIQQTVTGGISLVQRGRDAV